MTIVVQIPRVLRAECQGLAQLQLAAENVADALQKLEQTHPELYRSVCDETGAVRRHVNLFVNSSYVRVRDPEGLKAELRPGDVLSILPAVSGG